EFAGTRVPTFEETLDLARGRIGVYVDCKSISADDLVAALEKAGVASTSVIYGGVRLLERVAALRPQLRAMPEADNPAVWRGVTETLHLRVAAFGARDFNDETIAVARAAGVEIYVDRLGSADNESAWQDAVDRGAAGIQTDHPAELLAFLRSKGRHR